MEYYNELFETLKVDSNCLDIHNDLIFFGRKENSQSFSSFKKKIHFSQNLQFYIFNTAPKKIYLKKIYERGKKKGERKKNRWRFFNKEVFLFGRGEKLTTLLEKSFGGI